MVTDFVKELRRKAVNVCRNIGEPENDGRAASIGQIVFDDTALPLGLINSSKAPGNRFFIIVETIDFQDVFDRVTAMQKEIEERDETAWMLRLNTGDDAEHQKAHTTKRDVTCRFCRLEIYNEEQEAKEAESIAERKRVAEFQESMIPVAIADCCATCEYFIEPNRRYEDSIDCDKHDLDEYEDEYGMKCGDWRKA